MVASSWNWQDIYPNKQNKVQNTFNLNYNELRTDNQLEKNFEEIFTENSIFKRPLPKKINNFNDAFSLYKNRELFPTFTSLDFLLPKPYLLTGCLSLIHTPDKPGRAYLIQLFLKLMLKYYSQGIIFIDCINIFPAYELIESTIEMDPLLDPQLPVRAIQLSRSFNYHQTTETIKEQLEPLLRDGFSYNTTDSLAETPEKKFVKPKLIIVAGMSDLYLNRESAQYLEYDGRPAWWSIFELQEAIGYLRSLTLKYNCVTLISSSTASLSKSKSLGGKFLNNTSAVIAKLTTNGFALYGELIKHPFAGYNEKLLQILKKKGKKRATMPLSVFF